MAMDDRERQRLREQVKEKYPSLTEEQLARIEAAWDDDDFLDELRQHVDEGSMSLEEYHRWVSEVRKLDGGESTGELDAYLAQKPEPPKGE